MPRSIRTYSRNGKLVQERRTQIIHYAYLVNSEPRSNLVVNSQTHVLSSRLKGNNYWGFNMTTCTKADNKDMHFPLLYEVMRDVFWKRHGITTNAFGTTESQPENCLHRLPKVKPE